MEITTNSLLEIYCATKTLNYKKIDEYVENTHKLYILIFMVMRTKNITVIKYLLTNHKITHQFIDQFSVIEELIDYLFEFIQNLDNFPKQYTLEKINNKCIEINNLKTFLKVENETNVIKFGFVKSSNVLPIIEMDDYKNYDYKIKRINQNYIDKFADDEEKIMTLAHYCRGNLEIINCLISKFKKICSESHEHMSANFKWWYLLFTSEDNGVNLCKCLLENDIDPPILTYENDKFDLCTLDFETVKLIVEHYGDKLNYDDVISNMFDDGENSGVISNEFHETDDFRGTANDFDKKILLLSTYTDLKNMTKETIKHILLKFFKYSQSESCNKNVIKIFISFQYDDIIIDFLKEQFASISNNNSINSLENISDVINRSTSTIQKISTINLVHVLVDILVFNGIDCKDIIYELIEKYSDYIGDSWIAEYSEKYSEDYRFKKFNNKPDKKQEIHDENNIQEKVAHEEIMKLQEKNVAYEEIIRLTHNHSHMTKEIQDDISKTISKYIMETNRINMNLLDCCNCSDTQLLIDYFSENNAKKIIRYNHFTNICREPGKCYVADKISDIIINRQITRSVLKAINPQSVSIFIEKHDYDSLIYLFEELFYEHNDKMLSYLFKYILEFTNELPQKIIDMLFIRKLWTDIDLYIKKLTE